MGKEGWGEKVKCVAMCMTKPPRIEKALRSTDRCVKRLTGEECKFECIHDYVNRGILICDHGHWINKDSVCLEGCGDVRHTSGMKVKSIWNCPGMLKGEECKYECKSNFVGMGKLICGAREWKFGKMRVYGKNIMILI